MARVTVTAPARLHLGFLDMEGGLGRRFGSLGLTIERFATTVSLQPADSLEVNGVGELERARAQLERLTAAWGTGPVAAEINEVIPAHAGLGSGTQLGLALGMGLATLTGRAASPAEVARLLERGARSGIGIGGFAQGGFILDGGRGADGAPPPVTARLAFPPSWALLLIFDAGCEGLHGQAETGAFQELPPFPASLAGHLCRLVVMQLLPGIALADLDAVGAAIGEIQRRVGDHFAPAQGGRFTSPAVAEVLAWLEGLGVQGVGQSSWGPTGFGILATRAAAAELAAEAGLRFGGAHPSLRFEVVHARNRGAEISRND